MESTLIFYKFNAHEYSKNSMIDDLDDLLLTIANQETITNFQYVKHDLELTIKVNFSQSWIDNPSSTKDYNYLSIQNGSERVHYYFIMSKVWKSKECVECRLRLDVLNTFQWNFDYLVSNKTLVKREHKDRIKLLSGTLPDNATFQRVIDMYSEGINAPLHKVKQEDIIDKFDRTWSLMYKNQLDVEPDEFNPVNPVDCFLMPTEKTPLVYATSNRLLVPSDLASTYWFFNPNNENNAGLQFKGSNGVIYKMKSYGSKYSFIAIAIKKTASNYIELQRIRYDMSDVNASTFVVTYLETINTLTSLEILNTPPEVEYLTCPNGIPTTYATIYGGASGYTIQTISFPLIQGYSYLDNSFIDKTDSKVIKIIDLPYCPSEYEVFTESYTDYMNISPVWDYDTNDHYLKLKDLDTEFKRTIKVESSLNPFDPMIIDWTSEEDERPRLTDDRKDAFESKLFHSDFYAPKFVYDSFNLTFRCEWLDFKLYNQSRDTSDEYQGLGFDITFVMSRNIVSKFLFIFPQYITKYSEEDYDNIVAVSRNNEEVLYTSQYINYLRTGYNYDLKSKERNTISGALGLGGSVLSTILGVIGGFATQNVALAVGSAVLGGISIATQSVSYAKSIAEMESNIKEKLETAKNQAVAVQNADDLDLLTAYSGNRAKMCFYQVSPRMRQALADMFYYCGYATQEMKEPDLYTRSWFNFIQCDLVASEVQIQEKYFEEIKRKFSEGVTIYHHHKIGLVERYDLSQEKENYESWIFE